MTPLQQFNSLLAHLFPGGVGQPQLQEMERMFLSGYRTCFETIMRDVAPLPDDEAEARLSQMETEIKDYFRLLAKVPHKTKN